MPTRSKDLQLEIAIKYDRPILLHMKQSIIDTLQEKSRIWQRAIWLLGILIIVLIFLVFKYKMKQRRYFKKFNDLVLENQQSMIAKQKQVMQSIEVIPADIYNSIVLGLKNFETQNEFLKPTTLMELAKKLHTNSTYLSKFINNSTGGNFSQYVKRLRIQYVVKRLKTDSKLRSFTIKAIAEEIGFGSAQLFSKAFFLETGIYPSYFLRN